MSSSNTQLLQYYGFKQLRPKWSKCKTLAEIISLNLDKILGIVFDSEAYDRWQVTPTNIAELNKIVWTRLEESVTAALEAMQNDPEKAISEMLDAKQSHFKEERESVTYEPTSIHDVGDFK